MSVTDSERSIVDYSQEMAFALVPMLEKHLVFCGVVEKSFSKLPKYYIASVDYSAVEDDGEHIVEMMERVVDKFARQLSQDYVIVCKTQHNLWSELELCSFLIEGNKATFQIEYHDELFK